LKLDKRIRAVAGGTSASKTVSILLILIQLAQTRKNLTISIVSESMPHLKRGCIREFLNIMQAHGYYQESNFNKTDFIYKFSTGSIIEFFSADQPDKTRGPRRDVLFINEANNISYETFTQLEIRTNKLIWLDWNPVSEFWFYTELLGNRNDIDFLTLTYKDNEALPQAIIETIESRRNNKNWYRIYGEGQLGEAEGKIYTGWQIIDDIPEEARLERYGLDFGYSNDPTAITAVYFYNGGYILDEITHLKGLSNKQISDILTTKERVPIVADSAEPKSIDELISYGLNVIPAIKGPGSLLKGIQYVQQQRISVTKRSLNIIKEYRNYLWDTDKDGKQINEPIAAFDHQLDGIRYALNSLNNNNHEEDDFDVEFSWREEQRRINNL